MEKNCIIENTVAFVRQRLEGEGSGHDWWHVYRVWKLAQQIAVKEKADCYLVQLAALLHDIADWKFFDGDELIGAETAGTWLHSQGLAAAIIKVIQEVIEDVSFKGAGVKRQVRSIEGAVVQDADRLDALGAIGIARCFAYGGYRHREIYNPDVEPVMHQSVDEYKKNTSPSINHFYEKLLLLKDEMNTKTAKEIAEDRHAFMQKYLEQFIAEWESLSIVG